MCDEAMAALENQTSLCVKIVEKPYLLFRELCGAPVERFQETVDPELLRKGNCTRGGVPSTINEIRGDEVARSTKPQEYRGYAMWILLLWISPEETFHLGNTPTWAGVGRSRGLLSSHGT